MFLSIETNVKVWENSKKLSKQSPVAGVPTAFLILLNLDCFCSTIRLRARVIVDEGTVLSRANNLY